MKNKILITILVLAVLGVAVFWFVSRNDIPEAENPSYDTESTLDTDKTELEIDKVEQSIQNSTVTLADLTAEQIELFKSTSLLDVNLVKSGSMTIEDLDIGQDEIIEVFVMENMLPENGIELFHEWKDANKFYDQFSGSSKPQQNKDNGTKQEKEQKQDNVTPPVAPSKPSVAPDRKPSKTPEQSNKQEAYQSNHEAESDIGENTPIPDELREEFFQDIGGGGVFEWNDDI